MFLPDLHNLPVYVESFTYKTFVVLEDGRIAKLLLLWQRGEDWTQVELGGQTLKVSELDYGAIEAAAK